MERVVVTGIGLTSCLGNDVASVTSALRDMRSGIRAQPAAVEAGLRSQVAGAPEVHFEARIERKQRRFMGDAAAHACVAMQDAIADAGLEADQVASERAGVIAGSGGASPEWQIAVADLLRNRGVRKVGAFMVPKTMCSTVSANLATAFGIRGPSYSIAAACATSAHCIGAGADLIRRGAADIVFAGGGEELHWGMSAQFDAMGALSTHYNDTPETASRPYDASRDGFVIAGGGGILVLESERHARQRDARIHAVLAGYGVTSDGADMVAPSGEGAARCMRQALAGFEGTVDYINAHGTSTPAGDLVELAAIGEVFGNAIPPISSTKALTGHSLGAASVHEAIYCLLMMQHGFLAGSAHIENLDEGAKPYPILRQSREARPKAVLSNSFGFGGTNGSLLFTSP